MLWSTPQQVTGGVVPKRPDITQLLSFCLKTGLFSLLSSSLSTFPSSRSSLSFYFPKLNFARPPVRLSVSLE